MKKEITEKLIKNLKKDGAKEIRTVSGSATKPRSVGFKYGKKSYTPDIVANYGDKKDLFSIDVKYKKKDLPDLISKWILFGLTARSKGGNFYIVATKSDSKNIQSIIDEKKLSAELIKV